MDRNDVNFLAVSSSVSDIKDGGPHKYELYLRQGKIPTPYEYDQKSTVTAADSYVGPVLYR